MATLFKDFFVKFPMEFSEHTVIKQIHKTLECAEEEFEENEESEDYLEYMAKAYKMLEAYFTEKGVNPNSL